MPMKCLICADREPDRPAVCDPCRLWLPNELRDIAEEYAALAGEEPAETGRLLIEDDGGFDAPAAYDVHPLPAGPIRATARDGHVTGSRDAPVPVLLDVVDLTAPARLPNPTRGRGHYPRSLWPEDQIGHQPVATRLDLWVRDWITYQQCPGDHLPAPTVPALVRWLTVRCGWACDEHPAVDDFADEMRELLAELRRANEDGPVYAEPIKAVPCSGCDAVALFRPVKSSYRAECGMCGKLYTDDEYGRWTGLLAAQAQAKGRVA
jgi:hypothetical protein